VFLFLAVGFAVFGNTLGGEFVYDDHLVLSNSIFDEPARFLNFFIEPYFEDFSDAGLYRPLTLISFVPNFVVGGASFGFHLVNVFLHIANSLLVYIFLYKISRSYKLSLVASLPIHVEAVASIIGRAELLSFLFVILSALAWLKSRFIVASLFFFLGILSKETALVLPFILLLISWHYRSKLTWIIPFIVSGVGYFALRFVALGSHSFSISKEFVFNPIISASISERIATFLKVTLLYVQKILVPLNLSPDYSYNQITITNNFLIPSVILGVLLIVVLAYISIRSYKSKKNIFIIWAVLLFAAPYLLISNLFFPIGTIMAERLMYMPSLGIIMLLVFVAYPLSSKVKHRPYLAMAIFFLLPLYAVITINQNRVWANEKTLFSNMYEASPQSVVAQTHWAQILLRRGEVQGAKKLLLESFNLHKDFLLNLNLLAEIEKNEGNLEQSRLYLERAVDIMPEHEQTLISLSRVYFNQAKYDQANEILTVLVEKYGGVGNTVLYALSQVRSGDYEAGRKVIVATFGEETTDESAVTILSYIDLKQGTLEESGYAIRADIEREFLKLEALFLE